MKTIQIFIFSIISLLFVACSAPKTVQGPVYGSKEYYAELGSNINRLVALRSGTFVQYIEDLEHKFPFGLWTVGDGQDSVLTISRRVGSPSKDGHWLLSYVFMSHAPELALQVSLERFETTASRDTIVSKIYPLKYNPSFKEITDPNLDISLLELNALEKRQMPVEKTWGRKSALEYIGLGEFRGAGQKLEQDGFKYRKDNFICKEQRGEVDIYMYKSKDTPSIKYSTRQFLVRLPRKNQFWDGTTVFK